MKKRDIEKLKDAFDIPEPERKSEFIRIHGEKFAEPINDVPRKRIFRYAPVLALAAVLIGLWGFIKPDGSLRENPGKNNIVVESTNEIPTNVTTSAVPQTSLVSSAVQTDKKPITTSAVSQGETHIPENVTQPVNAPDQQESPETTEIVSVPSPSTERTSPAVTETTAKKTTSAAAVSSVTTVRRTNTAATSTANRVSVTTVPPSNPDDDDINNQHPSTDGEEDMTITPDIVYTKTDNIYYIGYDDMPNDSTTDSMGVDCDLSINGYVMDIIYTKAKNRPYTQLNILVTNVMTDTGKLSVGCMISVYIPGGYMPSDEYFAIYPNRKPYQGDYTVYDCAGISKSPEIGDIYSFYLNRDGEGIPDGAFVLASERPASMKKIA